jgi:hypothetical protein
METPTVWNRSTCTRSWVLPGADEEASATPAPVSDASPVTTAAATAAALREIRMMIHLLDRLWPVTTGTWPYRYRVIGAKGNARADRPAYGSWRRAA